MDDNKKFRNTKHCGGAVFKNGYKDNDKKPEWVNAEFEITGEFMKPLIDEYKKKYPKVVCNFILRDKKDTRKGEHKIYLWDVSERNPLKEKINV